MQAFFAALNRRFDRAFYAFCWFLSRVAALLLLDVRVYGRERVPPRGACLLAANHQSFLDPWVLGLSIPRRVFYLARDSLLRLPVLGSILWRLNVLPVSRGSVTSRRSLEEMIKVLRAGELLMMFPEGTRSGDGRFQSLKRGVALVARETQTPVLAVLIVGTYNVWPRHRKLPRLGWGGLARLQRREPSAPSGIRIFFGSMLEFTESESLRAFSQRLSGEYRRLALEAGVPELCRSPQADTVPSEGEENYGDDGNDGRLSPPKVGREQDRKSFNEESAAGTLPCFTISPAGAICARATP